MNTFQRVGLTLGWFAFVAMWCADWRAGMAVMSGAVLFASGALTWRIGQERRDRAARKVARQFTRRPVKVPEHVMGRCATEPAYRIALGKETFGRIGVVKFGEDVYMGKMDTDEVAVRRAANYRWN